MLVASILTVGFAEMVYTFSHLDCDGSVGDTPICSLREAYQLIYYLILGEPIVEIGNMDPLSHGMILLVALFTSLAFLLLLSLLVVVVVVASKCDGETVALDAYWEPKLALVLSSQDAQAAAASQRKGFYVPQPSCLDRLTAELEELWDVAISSLFGKGGAKEDKWYARSSLMWKNLCLRLACALFVPLWLAAGLASLGFLWPPQVRRFIFMPRGRILEQAKPNEAREFFVSQLAGVRNEVMKLKDMSYEQSNDVQKEIKELKAILVAAIND
jgi:hypothetical protein